MNVENEKGGAPGKVSAPSENFSDDAGILNEASLKVNGEPMPPAGCGHVYDDEGNRETVPVELHPTLLPEPEKLSRYRIVLRAVLEWVLICAGHPGKVTAFYVVIGEDKRELGEIAKALGITERMFRNYRAEARAWFSGFIAGLESEAVPTTGNTKP